MGEHVKTASHSARRGADYAPPSSTDKATGLSKTRLYDTIELKLD
jgi:hypothetical protein